MTRILVVDDVKADRRLVEGLLAAEDDFESRTASDGADALDVIKDWSPDLVVTDLQMPQIDGLELVTLIKEEFPQLPVILLTGKGSEEIAIEAISRGAASYVPKRIMSHDLVPTVRRVLATAATADNERLLLRHLESLSFDLENDASLISVLVGHLRAMLDDLAVLDESDRVRVTSAVLEALQNAYYHGNLELDSSLREQDGHQYEDLAKERLTDPAYQGRRIHFRMFIEEECIGFVVSDDGPGFHVGELPNPTDPEFFDRPHGRGVFLMRAFMDSVDFNDRGNEVTMIKHLSPQHQGSATPQPVLA
ncbi:ATP-binding response regulator [Stratiformator vulcanicus]|uniref:Chemotaxis protein CheY n=1 Tax=Stratiformator vulcanicus TaxID=2527980 RepID=A0A517R121_9PLAN|nr:response regulator [Stratiformator vulcanicus]QDT37556.1 Chemotaxis protein CheY [Stratiformator vulcanicus]